MRPARRRGRWQGEGARDMDIRRALRQQLNDRYGGDSNARIVPELGQLHETKGLPLLFWLSTKIKRESAEAYCARQGWRYKLVTKGFRWR